MCNRVFVLVYTSRPFLLLKISYFSQIVFTCGFCVGGHLHILQHMQQKGFFFGTRIDKDGKFEDVSDAAKKIELRSLTKWMEWYREACNWAAAAGVCMSGFVCEYACGFVRALECAGACVFAYA